jgi:hypothetical protein
MEYGHLIKLFITSHRPESLTIPLEPHASLGNYVLFLSARSLTSQLAKGERLAQ